ncbi:MAG: response regulator transcription factor [Acidobacteria bacterium]|nr:response regulator transcription factor [Acidobacteriota bacterium]
MIKEIKVAIVEDQKQTREGLAALISGTPGYRTVGKFASMEEALAKLEWEPPDVVLLDIGLPGISGIEGVRRLKARWPALQVLMLTVYADNEHIFEAVCGGACGYLLKDTPPTKLMEAVRELREGGAPMSPEIARKVVMMFQKVAPPKSEEHELSPRELQVLKLLADGHSYKTAADALSVSQDTIRFHIRNIYEKLHVHSKSEAVLKALRTGILS